jgi:hypothetical protein
MLEASGKSGAAEMARASEIDASAARSYGVPGAGDRRWMLYAGVGGGIGGLLLIAWGLAWRRRAG